MRFRPHLGGREDLANRQVILVSCRSNIVNRYRSSAQRGGCVLHLDPVRITRRTQILMDKALYIPRSAGNSIIEIIADAEDPRIVARGKQRCAWSASC